MRTLTLLTALVLLAIQTQAEPVHGRAEEILDQEQVIKNEKDMPITVRRDEGDENSAPEDADVLSGMACFCRSVRCVFPERQNGICRRQNINYIRCCIN